MYGFALWNVAVLLFTLTASVISTSAGGTIEAYGTSPAPHALAARARRVTGTPDPLHPKSTCVYYKVSTRNLNMEIQQYNRLTLALDLDDDGWRRPIVCRIDIMRSIEQYAADTGNEATVHKFKRVDDKACVIKIETPNHEWVLGAVRCLAAARKKLTVAPLECVSDPPYLSPLTGRCLRFVTESWTGRDPSRADDNPVE